MSAYPTTPAPSSSTEIVRRSSSLPEKLAYAEKLAQSGLLPSAYRRQPANVLYATEYGEMLGLAPLAAINGLHIIDGTPTASAGMVSALVRRAGHRLRQGYDKPTRTGWCEIVRHDDPEFTYRVEWTLDRAVIAGLCSIKDSKPYARSKKTGNPTPWELYPEAMLKARAITECAREACEEALNGVHYTPEELGAEVDEAGEPIRVTAERTDRPRDEAAPPNWDAELKEATGDVEALRALYDRARACDPQNTDLADRIKAAGLAAKAQATATTEVVDAEVVDEATPAVDPADARTAAHTEIHELLKQLDVARGDHEALLSGLVSRRTVAVGQLDDKATDQVLEELRNLVVLGQDRAEVLLAESIRLGEAYVPASPAVA